MKKDQVNEERRRIVDENNITCATCQAKLKGWENIRNHTLSVHGREPHFDREGRYPNRSTMLAAWSGAFPELIQAA